ncbi:MAG: NAD(P)H-hydrate dehydratase [Lachnospiraceae bacterium]
MEYLPGAGQMKAADSYTIHTLGVPSLELMERAAESCVRFLMESKQDMSWVCIVCGSGNNGGDGFAIGRLLLTNGYKVTAVMAGNRDHCTPECKKQVEMFEEAGGVVDNEFIAGEYSIIIDALFGVGLSRNIEGRYVHLLDRMNQSGAVKFAVDIPSGISADTGNIMGIAFRADYTVTFQHTKFGMELYPGKEYSGQVTVADIGISDEPLRQDIEVPVRFEERDYKKMLPCRKEDSNKGTFGKALIIAGSKGMSGAAYFNAKSAYMSGAGLVRIYTPEENRVILQQLLPEAIITTYDAYCEEELLKLIKWADVVCIGSGIGMGIVSQNILKTTLEQCEVPCVIDADGLNLLAEHADYLGLVRHHKYILTPHMKEMSRLCNISVEDIKKDRLNVLKEFTEETDFTCVLKDSRTLTGKKGERTVLNCSGNSCMAKAGSGDILAGVITGFLAQGMLPYDAAVLGTFIHGRSGDLARKEKGSYSVLAEDLMYHISMITKYLER